MQRQSICWRRFQDSPKRILWRKRGGFYEFIQNCENGRFQEARFGVIIHVAGTNGKGSVCAFLESICRVSGYRTAMFTSPHLVTTRERFCIDGSMISEEAFLEAFNWLSAQLRQYRKTKPDYSPTYFERLFLWASMCLHGQTSRSRF